LGGVPQPWKRFQSVLWDIPTCETGCARRDSNTRPFDLQLLRVIFGRFLNIRKLSQTRMNTRCNKDSCTVRLIHGNRILPPNSPSQAFSAISCSFSKNESRFFNRSAVSGIALSHGQIFPYGEGARRCPIGSLCASAFRQGSGTCICADSQILGVLAATCGNITAGISGKTA
jgi:hypothetical protein